MGKWENDLKRNTEQFTLRYKVFQQQLTELQKRNNELEIENKVKDQLLSEKSKIIINKITEIVKLKDEISKLTPSKVKKPQLSKRSSCPPYSLSIPTENTENKQDSKSTDNYHHVEIRKPSHS